jgi:hypothetical protein
VAIEGSSDGVVVRILIFSGRPDPTYVIDDEAQIAGVRRAVAGAAANPDFRGETVLLSALGYKGILVRNLVGAEGLPQEILVKGSDVELRSGGAKAEFRRDEGQLEKLLLDIGREKRVVDDDLLTAFGSR